jgi:hypothetical protein
MNATIPFQVRDIWLATFALERGATLQGAHRDERGYLYWEFDVNEMQDVMMAWGSGTAQVERTHLSFSVYVPEGYAW